MEGKIEKGEEKRGKRLQTGGPEVNVHNKNGDCNTGLLALEYSKGLILDTEILSCFTRLTCGSRAKGKLCV